MSLLVVFLCQARLKEEVGERSLWSGKHAVRSRHKLLLLLTLSIVTGGFVKYSEQILCSYLNLIAHQTTCKAPAVPLVRDVELLKL